MFAKLEVNFCRWEVDFDKRKGENFGKWEEGYFDIRLVCNKLSKGVLSFI